MKRTWIGVSLVFMAAVLYGHAPSSIDVTFDAKKSLLKAIVNHDLSDSIVKEQTKHFVKTVTVSVNNDLVITENFTSQENPDGETVIYKIRAKKGDKIKVQAFCSIFGSYSKEITIP